MGKQVQMSIAPNSQQTRKPVQNQEPNKRFWNFIKNAAIEDNEESVELRIEGDIIDTEDAWIYEWFGIPVASPNAFRNELAQYAGKDIIVWIDSYGGSVFAATGIYNALMEHKQSGAKVTAKVTKAMSAATIPMMAADERLMTPGGIFMMHNPLTSASGYASDLRKVAEVLDTVKETIINAYQLGTGLSRAKISSMMDDETYMSAKTAIKDGFATGMLYVPDNGTDNQDGILNFSFSHMAIQNSMSATMKKISEIAKISQSIDNQEGTTQNESTFPGAVAVMPVSPDVGIKNQAQEVKKEMEIKNVTDLQTQLPAIHGEVYNSGVAAERERLKAFDVLNGKVDPTYLAQAKYEDGATAEKVYFKAMQEGKLIDASYVAKAEQDASSANQVPGAASDNTKPDEVTGILNKVSAVAKKTLGIEGGSR